MHQDALPAYHARVHFFITSRALRTLAQHTTRLPGNYYTHVIATRRPKALRCVIMAVQTCRTSVQPASACFRGLPRSCQLNGILSVRY